MSKFGKIRLYRGSLEESMKTTREINTQEELDKFFLDNNFDPSSVKFYTYVNFHDARVNWERTYLIKGTNNFNGWKKNIEIIGFSDFKLGNENENENEN